MECQDAGSTHTFDIMWLYNLIHVVRLEPLHHGGVRGVVHVDGRARDDEFLHGMRVHVGHSVGNKPAIAGAHNAKLQHIQLLQKLEHTFCLQR